MGVVVVTGMGAVSSLGSGVAAHRDALWRGRTGIRPITRFDTSSLGTQLGAMWPEWEGRVQPEPGRDRDLFETAESFPLHELAICAAREAWSQASPKADPKRVALVFGTCFGQGFEEFSAVALRIAAALEIEGPSITISTACSSSTNAIGLARDLLSCGHADVVVAGGADTLLREAVAGFSALGVLSQVPCAPFSEPVGTTLGEGAGFLVLERSDDASRRGAPNLGSIHGYGLSADGFHETTPDPSGSGISRAIRSALVDANWLAREVDFVSAHATGTANNDHVEWTAILRELARAVPVSGSKGHLGHTQGASGVLELIVALVCHREGRVPPTLHFRGPRSGCPSDPIADLEPRPMTVARALKLSAAFGGANAVLAYGCGEVPANAPRPRAHVVLEGVGVVGPAGTFRLADAVSLRGASNVGACREVDVDALGLNPRLDRSSRWLSAAAVIALEATRGSREQTGLFVGATRMPEESSRKCTDSIRQRGVAGTSASAFARMSVNAPTGSCSAALGLLGPTSTLSIGEGSGLLAIALAADWLAARQDASAIVAGAVSEPYGALPDEAEGAVCVALGRSFAPPRASLVVAAWAIAGPKDARACVERTTLAGKVGGVIVDGARALVDDARQWVTLDGEIGVVAGSELWGESEAVRSAAMVAFAASLLSAGRARSILIVSERGASSIALVLTREDDR